MRPVDGHNLRLKYAAIARQSPRVDSAAYSALDFGAFGIYIQESRGNSRIMDQIAPAR